MFDAKMITKNNIMALVNGTTYTAAVTHPRFNDLVRYLNEDNVEDFIGCFDVKKFINKSFEGTNVSVKDNVVYYGSAVINDAIAKRIPDIISNGEDPKKFVLFIENLMNNPSSNSIQEAPDFLTHENLPITDDGCFFGYKTVKSDWYSKASGNLTLLQGRANEHGQIFNGIGEVIECPRREVDDVADRTCSRGLHVGSLEYAGPGGWYNSSEDRVVIVKVNPKDIVSVPSDHNGQKLRVCKYEVVGEYKGALNKPVYNSGESLTSRENEVDIYSIEHGDYISFDYDGQKRYIFVERDVLRGDTIVCGELLEEDPSYEEGQYRNFTISRMSNVEFD